MGMASSLDTVICSKAVSYARDTHAKSHDHLVACEHSPCYYMGKHQTTSVGFRQDHQIAAEAGHYAQVMIPSLFVYVLLHCLVRFLQTQNIVFPIVFSTGVNTLLHLLMCWLWVFKSGFGSRGAALATAISYWINVILLAQYVKFSSSRSKTWTGFSVEALHNIPAFVRLSIPSACMVCLEMWSFELMVLLAGLPPNPALETSVFLISLNTAATVWMIPFGLSSAVRQRRQQKERMDINSVS